MRILIILSLSLSASCLKEYKKLEKYTSKLYMTKLERSFNKSTKVLERKNISQRYKAKTYKECFDSEYDASLVAKASLGTVPVFYTLGMGVQRYIVRPSKHFSSEVIKKGVNKSKDVKQKNIEDKLISIREFLDKSQWQYHGRNKRFSFHLPRNEKMKLTEILHIYNVIKNLPKENNERWSEDILMDEGLSDLKEILMDKGISSPKSLYKFFKIFKEKERLFCSSGKLLKLDQIINGLENLNLLEDLQDIPYAEVVNQSVPL